MTQTAGQTNRPPTGSGRSSAPAGSFFVPVAGVTLNQIADTFGAPRSGGRKHAGIDIFSAAGTPVLAATGGTVVRAGNDGGNAGNRVWVMGDDGRAYFYAHLQGINAQQGQRVHAGQQLGTVGTTGNARGTPPHLHFSVNHRVGPENPVGNPLAFMRERRAQTLQAPGGPAQAQDGVVSPPPASASSTDPRLDELIRELGDMQQAFAERQKELELQGQAQAIHEEAARIDLDAAMAQEQHRQQVLSVMNTLAQRQPRSRPMPTLQEPQITEPGPVPMPQLDIDPPVARRRPQERGESPTMPRARPGDPRVEMAPFVGATPTGVRRRSEDELRRRLSRAR